MASALAELAHPEMVWIWSEEYQVRWERRLWVTVMEHQRRLGVRSICAWHLVASGDATPTVDLESIERRERVTRHDVKARLEEFCALAGHEKHHLGMTSADVVDNGMLYRMRASLALLHQFTGDPEIGAAVLAVPWRGIKGAIGTMQDQIDLLGSEGAALELDRAVADRFGFGPDRVLGSVGQVYPRSIDLEVVSAVLGLVLQRAADNPLRAVVVGAQAALASNLVTWNEGDVSQSASRRWAIPSAFLAASGAVRSGVDTEANGMVDWEPWTRPSTSTIIEL